MEYVFDKEHADFEVIGAKAKNLIGLSKLGFKVPDFICVSCDFLSDLLGVVDLDFQSDEGIRASAERVQSRIRDLVLPTAFLDELEMSLWRNIPDCQSFSVRSSTLIEDSADFSFAGQFDSFLNVSRDGLGQAILDCLASLYNANVLKHFQLNDLDFALLKMGIIVQEMVPADSSGVLFTANPQGIINETVIVNGLGTGDGIVEDRVFTNTYYYSQTDKIYYYESRGNVPVLSENLVNELVKVSKKISESFGKYLDIEYLVKDESVYILQTRPITTIDDRRLTVLDSSNIVESYPGITLPLTFSFVKVAYRGVFRNAAEIIWQKPELLTEFEDTFQEMVTSVNGRAYYKISNWYRLILALPFSSKLIPIWQEMLGVRDKQVTALGDAGLGLLRRLRIDWRAIRTFFAVPERMAKLEQDFQVINDSFYRNYSEKATNQELLALYGMLEEKILAKWGITLLNDAYAFVFTALAMRRGQTFSGISEIESMKPLQALNRLAERAIREERVPELAAIQSDEDAEAYLAQNGSFQAEIQRYIADYGDRSLAELKLESKTFRSAPLGLLKNVLEITRQPEKAQIDTVKEALPEKPLRFLSKRALLGIQNRESSRLNRSRIFGMVRSIFLTIGQNLKNDDKIEDARDIFYLKMDEVFDFVKSAEPVDLKGLVRRRKQEFSLYYQLPAYTRLVFAGPEWSKHHQNVNAVAVAGNAAELSGIPCSAGRVTGEVLVITDPSKAGDVRGKILVTQMTDPGWVFLLHQAKGIITEKGSLLSHTAIISRELKIPSIVAVEHVPELLKTGDILEMDGSTGFVRKVGTNDV
ncbi:MAG: phosphoenolpyruvate synthase [Streptococcaceae bacterium]|jgi:pyruvate,water dikinase|nr:phosphoenolpyruvate synthase [Streptococcaceae bacterium]